MGCCACQNPFESTLRYSSPAHGGWGVVRMGHLLPESYQLFVSPAACGRHGAISACMQGRKNRVSYLYLSEDDIVSGGYEELLLDAVDELLSHLERMQRTPKVLMVFVSCIDDLLATDHDALLVQLHDSHPEIRFTFCHMNPTSMDTGVPPPVNIQNKIYSLLEVTALRDNGINLIGNLMPLHEGCEIFGVLGQMGARPVRHVTDYAAFADFQNMAKSRLNLVLTPPGKYSAERMQKKHGTPFCMALVSYDPQEVTGAYGEISEFLGARCPDLRAYQEESSRALEETARLLDGMPVVLDGDAVARPFGLARVLLQNGFIVARVIAQKVIDSDCANYEWICEHYPQLSVKQPQHHRALLFEDRMPECLAIGYNSAYMTDSAHIVAVDGHQGHWGYHGIQEMMRLIREAHAGSSQLKALIAAAGLVV